MNGLGITRESLPEMPEKKETALFSSFVRTIQSFVCLAEPEAGAGSTNDPKPAPDQTTDVSAGNAATSAENPPDGLAPRIIRSVAADSGASTHPVG
jgi:hypothetical protein